MAVLTVVGSTADDCVNVLLGFRTLDVNCADLRLTTPLHWAAGLPMDAYHLVTGQTNIFYDAKCSTRSSLLGA